MFFSQTAGTRATRYYVVGVRDARAGAEPEQQFAYHADGENYRLGMSDYHRTWEKRERDNGGA